MTTRRSLLAYGAGLAALSAMPQARAAARDFSDADFRRAIVIDGLGNVDDPGSDPNATVMSAPGISALRASGLTAAHFKINQV